MASVVVGAGLFFLNSLGPWNQQVPGVCLVDIAQGPRGSGCCEAGQACDGLILYRRMAYCSQELCPENATCKRMAQALVVVYQEQECSGSMCPIPTCSSSTLTLEALVASDCQCVAN